MCSYPDPGGTLATDSQIKRVIKVTEHTHEPNHESIKAKKLKNQMKKLATNTRATTGQVLMDTLSPQPLEVQLEFPNLDTVKRNIRRKQSLHPALPKSLEEFNVFGKWKTTGTEDQTNFFIFDKSLEDGNRVLAFATDLGLEALSSAHTWYMDATFKSSPEMFFQLLIIRIHDGSSSISCVYSLMTSKAKDLCKIYSYAITDTYMPI